MVDSYKGLNPYKTIVFLTKEAHWQIMGSRKRAREFAEFKEFSKNLVEIVYLDPDADHMNGRVPQDQEHIEKFVEKSEVGPGNHFVIMAHEGGAITQAASKYDMSIMPVYSFSADKIVERAFEVKASIS